VRTHVYTVNVCIYIGVYKCVPKDMEILFLKSRAWLVEDCTGAFKYTDARAVGTTYVLYS